MDLLLIAENDVLAALVIDTQQSPEQFLCELEDALERGDLTIEEVTQLINDFNRS